MSSIQVDHRIQIAPQSEKRFEISYRFWIAKLYWPYNRRSVLIILSYVVALFKMCPNNCFYMIQEELDTKYNIEK